MKIHTIFLSEFVLGGAGIRFINYAKIYQKKIIKYQ